MTKLLIASAISLAAVVAADVARAAPDGWSSDLESARREAKKSGRPIWVVARCER
jgi:hypothetical protein